MIPRAKPIVQGSTRPTLPIAFTKDDGSVIILTGATLAAKRKKMGQAGAGTAISGSLSLTDGPNGKVTISYAAADVAVFGDILFQITATVSGQPYIQQYIQPILEAI
jgi:hypothetical protein